jgi:hypothetical protein
MAVRAPGDLTAVSLSAFLEAMSAEAVTIPGVFRAIA